MIDGDGQNGDGENSDGLAATAVLAATSW